MYFPDSGEYKVAVQLRLEEAKDRWYTLCECTTVEALHAIMSALFCQGTTPPESVLMEIRRKL